MNDSIPSGPRSRPISTTSSLTAARESFRSSRPRSDASGTDSSPTTVTHAIALTSVSDTHSATKTTSRERITIVEVR